MATPKVIFWTAKELCSVPVPLHEELRQFYLRLYRLQRIVDVLVEREGIRAVVEAMDREAEDDDDDDL